MKTERKISISTDCEIDCFQWDDIKALIEGIVKVIARDQGEYLDVYVKDEDD